MIKEKKCKGQNKAFGFDGCGKLTPQTDRKYGLCRDCLRIWMVSTNEGGKYIKKLSIEAKKDVKRANKKETEEAKINLLSTDKYRSKYVQPIINEIARIIDHGQPCIATGNYEGKMAGGHCISVGSNRSLSLNLHNIHKQSFHSNSWKGGDETRYREGIIKTYGSDYYDYINSLRQMKPLKLTLDDLKEVKSIALEVRKELRKSEMKLPPKERIELRNYVNKTIGVYSDRFSIFN